jgi:hypothetical protein
MPLQRYVQRTVAVAFVLLAGCGLSVPGDAPGGLSGGVPIRATYDVIVKKGHALEVTIDGVYRPYASVKEAARGQADMFLEAKGTVTYENKSPDEAVQGGDALHVVAYMLPFEACVLSPVYAHVIHERGLTGAHTRDLYCPVKIASLVSPDLEPGQSVTEALDVFSQDQPVAVEDVKARVAAARKAPVIAGGPERYEISRSGLNPHCRYGPHQVARAQLFSTDPAVTACSTEP